jgi:hypothetical protein
MERLVTKEEGNSSVAANKSEIADRGKGKALP